MNTIWAGSPDGMEASFDEAAIAVLRARGCKKPQYKGATLPWHTHPEYWVERKRIFAEYLRDVR